MNHQSIIEEAWQSKAITPEVKQAVLETIEALDQGKIRVAEKKEDQWLVNEWVKIAILLYFRISENHVMAIGDGKAFDKVPLKFADWAEEDFKTAGFRVVPPAFVRKGSFIDKGAVLMPSYVNIGAWVGEGTMVDTWATVGSCAQIGKHVHLSGGVGIGGVLEPLQSSPTIIEDHCFIGARSEIVEGVIVEEGAVIGMGVYIGQSTKIYDRESGTITYGRVPKGAVVVSGSLPAQDGTHALYGAIIVKRVDEKTRAKVAINELLRA
jgi:2,3,4,5-tetrahydropyridine-2-carboxylate N-succinyltransferase